MAWSRRGSRPILVDGHTLRWVVHRGGVPGCPDCDRGHLLVGLEDRQGSSLRVPLGERTWDGRERPVTPSIVAAAVRLALEEGWVPGSGGTDRAFLSQRAEQLVLGVALAPSPSGESPRPYPYVGPEHIRLASQGQPEGFVIESPEDLRAFALQQAPDVEFTFVVDLAGRLRLAPRRSEHVACAGGQDVLAAGELRLSRPAGGATPIVEAATNQSTGYCPEPACWSALAAAIARARLEGPSGWAQAFTFRRCVACGQTNLVKAAWTECAVCGTELPEAWNFGAVV